MAGMACEPGAGDGDLPRGDGDMALAGDIPPEGSARPGIGIRPVPTGTECCW